MRRDATIDAGLLRRMYARAEAGAWGLTDAQFGAALGRAVEHLAADAADGAEVERRCAALHLEDLALACACEVGIDRAWQHFVLTYRPILYRAADAIDPAGGARELADALYGDLFGTTERDGTRQSLFRYFHGRSSLATWLRAVLAQRQVDRVRSGRLLDPLPEDEGSGPAAAAPTDPEGPRLRALVVAAIGGAIAVLAARDRLRLGCYYAQQMTLAQVGRLTGEHEATVSRQLARTRAAIRETVERLLRDDHHLQTAEIDEGFRLIADDPGPLDLAALFAEGTAGKESALDRSTRGTRT